LDRKQTVVAVLDSRKLPSLAKKGIKPLDKVYFFEQLEAACSVGFDLARAMETAHISISGKTSSSKALKEITGEIGRNLRQGELLAGVAPRFPNLFSEVALGLIEAGEHSGSLSETFGSVRQLASRDEKLRDNLVSLCLYPAMFLAVAAVVVYQLATGPLPQLARVLEYLKRRFTLAIKADRRNRQVHRNLSNCVSGIYRRACLFPCVPSGVDQADSHTSQVGAEDAFHRPPDSSVNPG
jgi:type II secretory pathway component PulF